MKEVEKEGCTDAGGLFLCATPIGNLEDITIRVLDILKKVDLIAAEDTRNTIKLLNHYNIKTPMTSYHEFNKIKKADVLIDKMQQGMNIALVTDAGTPGISDPGEELVKMCYKSGISVTSLPGAAACITALTLSGQSTRRFVFEAFLPSDKRERRKVLDDLVNETRTIIVYEAPHRLLRTIKELSEYLGADRVLTICKELTKRHEAALIVTLGEAICFYEEHAPRGEYVLVISGKNREEIEKNRQERWDELDIKEHMDIYIRQGKDKKEAMKLVAKDRGITKRDVYQSLL